MPIEVEVALITLIGSVIGTVGGILATNKLTTFRLEQLERKVDKHNNLLERTYKIEQELEVLKNREKTSEHRIEDLEENEKKMKER